MGESINIREPRSQREVVAVGIDTGTDIDNLSLRPVEELNGHQGAACQDEVVAVCHVVAQTLCNVGIRVPDGHVVLHGRYLCV